MYCPNCKSLINDNSYLCPNCGCVINSQNFAPQNNVQQNYQSPYNQQPMNNQVPYNQPNHNAYNQYNQNANNNSSSNSNQMGIISLALALFGLSAYFFGFSLLASIAALVCGIIGITNSNKVLAIYPTDKKAKEGKQMSIAGIIVSCLSIVPVILIFIGTLIASIYL